MKTLYSKDHERIVSRLKQARLASGLVQEDAAKYMKTTQSSLSKLESGQRRVDAAQLVHFAKLYKKPINFFFKE